VAAAGRTVGIAGSIVPIFFTNLGRTASLSTGNERQTGPPEQLAQARAIVARWLDASTGHPSALTSGAQVYAAVRAQSAGFLAACVDGVRPALIASLHGKVSDAAVDIETAARIAEGNAAADDDASCRAALSAIGDWWSGRRAARDAGLTGVVGARVRLKVLARIASIYHRAPRHVRPRLTPLVDRARHAALTPCGIGAESILGQLAGATLTDGAWLRAVGAFGDAYAAGQPPAPESRSAPTVVGLILFVPAATASLDTVSKSGG
jgi:hypothetical protein